MFSPRNQFLFCVELTNHCNFRCVYCPHSLYGQSDTPSGSVFNRPKSFMALDLFRKSIREAQRWARVYSLGFFGEQQMHPQFDQLIREVPARQDRKFQFTLNTNFSLVTEETVETLKHFDRVRISFDATTKEMWEALCPGSALLMKDGVKGQGRYETLVEKTKWYLSLKNRPSVYLIYVRQHANAGDDRIFLKHWRPRIRKGDALLTKSILTFGGVMHDKVMKRRPCRVPSENRFVVAWDGRCTPCSLDVNIAMEAGNLTDSSVGKIVNSKRWADRLQGIRDRVGICANCFDGQNHGIKIVGSR